MLQGYLSIQSWLFVPTVWTLSTRQGLKLRLCLRPIPPVPATFDRVTRHLILTTNAGCDQPGMPHEGENVWHLTQVMTAPATSCALECMDCGTCNSPWDATYLPPQQAATLVAGVACCGRKTRDLDAAARNREDVSGKKTSKPCQTELCRTWQLPFLCILPCSLF